MFNIILLYYGFIEISYIYIYIYIYIEYNTNSGDKCTPQEIIDL